MSDIMHLFLGKLTLLNDKLQFRVHETRKNKSKTWQVVHKNVSKRNNVIKARESSVPHQSTEYGSHEALESCGSAAQSKGHCGELVECSSRIKSFCFMNGRM